MISGDRREAPERLAERKFDFDRDLLCRDLLCLANSGSCQKQFDLVITLRAHLNTRRKFNQHNPPGWRLTVSWGTYIKDGESDLPLPAAPLKLSQAARS